VKAEQKTTTQTRSVPWDEFDKSILGDPQQSESCPARALWLRGTEGLMVAPAIKRATCLALGLCMCSVGCRISDLEIKARDLQLKPPVEGWSTAANTNVNNSP
jgi:hypothetical protein